MKRVTKKVPLLPNSAKKYTLISDLLRSEPYPEKTPFSENFSMHMLTHRESGPPGCTMNSLFDEDIFQTHPPPP